MGNDEYKAMCGKLAAEHGFKITNPELQESIQQERQRIQQERVQAMKSEQLKQFERYAEAVGAERYRVTSIKMREDGSKQTFILDKKDGITRVCLSWTRAKASIFTTGATGTARLPRYS